MQTDYEKRVKMIINCANSIKIAW